MTKAASMLLAVLLGLGVAGCESKTKPAGDTAAAGDKTSTTKAVASGDTKATTAASGSATPYADVDDKDIPDESDFDEEAEKDITDDNYESKLDELAKEIGEGDEEAAPEEEKK